MRSGDRFGSLLKSLREKASLSLREVESITGVSNAYLSQIESGKVGAPSPKILERLAGAFKVPYLSLLSAAGHLTPSALSAASAESMSSQVVDLSGLSDAEQGEVIAFVERLKTRKATNSTDLPTRRKRKR